ncbi:DUF5333 domain-containing protein [Tateyamaria sp. ANG-S1]|uniref:DUF5333 domain-containing protein n=1 Tax=Tateyamaria sp. ANG-S1 TaxID=1577905 RepID=UPI00057DA6DE|nr:DUF5333 domain-containing protein [Tateyamaria sp. ANG-S1]KIC48495.1 hypothetical protein RA29_12180 [Tateyamaria sp. ANG-S1]
MRAMTMALILSLTAGIASAKPHLRDVPEIDGTLLAVGIADEIRKNCPDISARMLRAYTLVTGLKDKARAMGYSDAEIDAYRKSDAEKNRLKGARKAYLDAAGVTPGQPAGYCALGRAEIERGGQIGALLRMN